jgi:hypothetical protein
MRDFNLTVSDPKQEVQAQSVEAEPKGIEMFLVF